MAGTEPTRTVVLASGNAGKLREFQRLLAPLSFLPVAQHNFEVPEVEETGLTFVENAILKARAAASHSGLPAIADDSGLEVDHLEGAPGIHSARYSATGGDAANVRKLLTELEDVPEALRGARFVCVAVLLRHPADPLPIVCEGRWEGTIARAPRGSGGFGYDPVFISRGDKRSAAELQPDEKNRISHRGRAFEALLERLRCAGGSDSAGDA